MQKAALFAYLAERYQARPEYLWRSQPEYAVFRAANQKWFALYLFVEAAKLGLSGNQRCAVLNVKAAPQDIAALCLSPDIFPAYHMNKRHWISLRLEPLSAAFCQSLIDNSYALVSTQK